MKNNNSLPEVKNKLPPPKMKAPKFQDNNWQEEFKDELSEDFYFERVNFDCEHDLLEIVQKYLLKGTRVKVKVKCKDGMIQIERIGL